MMFVYIFPFREPLHGPLRAFVDGAAATLLLGLVMSGAQWLLARIYGEKLQ